MTLSPTGAALGLGTLSGSPGRLGLPGGARCDAALPGERDRPTFPRRNVGLSHPLPPAWRSIVGCTTTTLIRVVPIVVDLRLYEGDDVFLRVVVTDPDTMGPADLTGYTAQSQIRSAASSADIMAEFATEIVDNFVYLTLTSADTTGQVGRGVWDVQLTDPDGVVGTVAGGRVTWVAEVTR